MSTPDSLSQADINAITDELDAAARMFRAWAHVIGKNNRDGHRADDIRFLVERAQGCEGARARLAGAGGVGVEQGKK